MYIKFDESEPIRLVTGINEFNGEELHVKVDHDTSADALRDMALHSTVINVYEDPECTKLVNTYEYYNRVISTSKIENTTFDGGYVYIILKKMVVDYKYYEAAKILFGEEA